MFRDRIWRFTRACIVGGGATAVDFTVLSAGVRLLHLLPTTARLPALLAGASVQFFGNRTFTFRAQHENLGRQAKLFVVFEAATLALNWSVFRVLQPRLGALPPEIVSFFGTFLTFVAFAYPVRRLVIFRRSSSAEGLRSPNMPQRDTPGPGQESVWDYPRPPRIEPTARRIRIVFGGLPIVDTKRALRVLETSHPPVYYVPLADIAKGVLSASSKTTSCEFKGAARYFVVAAGWRTESDAAWTYDDGPLKGHVAFYPSRMDTCMVDDERARPQEGSFYGGWITTDLAGPFKGGPGTQGW